MEGKNFSGLKFDWNYDSGYADIKIPNYVSNALNNFQHTPSPQIKYYPHSHNQIKYREKCQYAKGNEVYKNLNKK